jgi:hypothetical protein
MKPPRHPVLRAAFSSWRSRLVFSIGVGAMAALYNVLYTSSLITNYDALTDWDQVWTAAVLLLSGGDPYTAIGPDPNASFRGLFKFYYPATTAAGVIPLAWLPLDVARPLFVFISFTLLSWVLSAGSSWRLVWLLSFPAVQACALAQWSPLLTAAALHPRLHGLLALKPQTAALWFIHAPSWRRLAWIVSTGFGLALVSYALLPTWPGSWLALLPMASTHLRPFLEYPALWPLAPLLLWHWRRPDARLVLALSVVPLSQALYEMLPIMLIARTQWQLAILIVAGVLGEGARVWVDLPVDYEYLLAVLFHLPASMIVLWNVREERRSTADHAVDQRTENAGCHERASGTGALRAEP